MADFEADTDPNGRIPAPMLTPPRDGGKVKIQTMDLEMNAVERIGAVKTKFRDGRRSEAVAECEALVQG